MRSSTCAKVLWTMFNFNLYNFSPFSHFICSCRSHYPLGHNYHIMHHTTGQLTDWNEMPDTNWMVLSTETGDTDPVKCPNSYVFPRRDWWLLWGLVVKCKRPRTIALAGSSDTLSIPQTITQFDWSEMYRQTHPCSVRLSQLTIRLVYPPGPRNFP